jgi:hypothetical protein
MPETTPGLSVCASGRHTWIDPDHARRCNGFLRRLVVACPGRGEALPEEASSVSALPGARCGFVWVPAPNDQTTTPTTTR